MIIQVTEEFRIRTKEALPHIDDAEAFSAFHQEIAGIRKRLVEDIRERTKDEDAVYAPCYHAVLDTGEEHTADIFAVEYFDSMNADHSKIRLFKRAVKAAVDALPDSELVNVEGSAFEGSLMFFHELNDLVSEQSDALQEEYLIIYSEKDFLNGELNTAVLDSRASYGFLLAESNIRCNAAGKGRKMDMLKELDGKLGHLRFIMKEKLMEALEEERDFHLFPGSFVTSYNTESHVLTTRFFDIIGFPHSLSRDEAERIIFSSYEEAGRALNGEKGCNELSYPVISDTDIIPDNPIRFFTRLKDKAESLRDGKSDLDEDGFRYF